MSERQCWTLCSCLCFVQSSLLSAETAYSRGRERTSKSKASFRKSLSVEPSNEVKLMQTLWLHRRETNSGSRAAQTKWYYFSLHHPCMRCVWSQSEAKCNWIIILVEIQLSWIFNFCDCGFGKRARFSLYTLSASMLFVNQHVLEISSIGKISCICWYSTSKRVRFVFQRSLLQSDFICIRFNKGLSRKISLDNHWMAKAVLNCTYTVSKMLESWVCVTLTELSVCSNKSAGVET